jgi:hypothetical protein
VGRKGILRYWAVDRWPDSALKVPRESADIQCIGRLIWPSYDDAQTVLTDDVQAHRLFFVPRSYSCR